MTPPATHQALLDAWVIAQTSVINEYSGDIAGDVQRLYADAAEYAAANGLDAPVLPDWYRPENFA